MKCGRMWLEKVFDISSFFRNLDTFDQTVEHENAAEHIEPKRPLPPQKSHYFPHQINVEKACTLPETNIAPENGWLEY